MTQAAHDTGAIRERARAAAETASSIEHQLRHLHAQMEGMLDSWRGPAAIKMRDMYNRYNGDAQKMAAELNRISHILKNVAARAEENETGIASLFDIS